jgi:branched-chain amino acid transport system ATP-binding protein
MAELLRLDGVSAGYGEAVALHEIGLTLAEGEAMAVLGRNGMGKTTLLTTLVGATRLHAGRLWFGGGEITRLPSHRRAEAGLGWVPQEREIFPSLTVEENLTAVARPGGWTVRRAFDMFPRLEERRRNFGNQLSGGEQQMLAIARALVLNPRLLLLDEPLEGLAPIIVQELLAAIRAMARSGSMAMLLVEQHARQILPLTETAIVLERGRIVHRGPSIELAADPTRLDRWLGVAAALAS